VPGGGVRVLGTDVVLVSVSGGSSVAAPG
jgi:hypothetical protein